MAVQARHFAHDLPPAVGGSLFLDEYAAGDLLLCCVQAERMRAALEEARRRHARALAAAVGRAASGRLRASETGLARALRRNAELEEEARQAAAECQAWMGVARGHEPVAAGLRAALDKLLRLPCGGAAWGGCKGGGDHGCEGGGRRPRWSRTCARAGCCCCGAGRLEVEDNPDKRGPLGSE